MGLKARHDLTPVEIDGIEDRLYEHNRLAVGRDDGEGLGFVMEDDTGLMIGAAAGYTWAGVSEIKQMWVRHSSRGQGFGRTLLRAMVKEARRRGVLRIWVSSYDFQAPGFYEREGFERVVELQGWPEGHVNVILCKTFPTTRNANGGIR